MAGRAASPSLSEHWLERDAKLPVHPGSRSVSISNCMHMHVLYACMCLRCERHGVRWHTHTLGFSVELMNDFSRPLDPPQHESRYRIDVSKMRSDGHCSSLPLTFIPVSHCSVHVPSCLQVYSNMRRSTRARPRPAWQVTKIALGCSGHPADRRASWAVNSLLLVSDCTTCLLPADWLTTRQARRQRQRQQ